MLLLREAIKKKIFDCGHTYPGPPPLSLTALGFSFLFQGIGPLGQCFWGLFLDVLVCCVHHETDFVQILAYFKDIKKETLRPIFTNMRGEWRFTGFNNFENM